MEINNKKNHLFRILIFFIMLLFAMGLTMNVLFCSNYNLYELLAKPTVIETMAISESIVTSEDGDDTTHFKASFLNKNNSHTEMITAAVPNGFGPLLILIIVLLFYFSALFILLPDEWTLINQKVRLDD
ncbi:hypothetical protein [Hungatella sp.]|uniref:hypothetical protein n=1 Tax=Hungatella sp. TaxID=2613924 RepID=UPI002A8016D4|nr:hypothetical protein [Hungatella sp.]